jgi:hypothetical protein
VSGNLGQMLVSVVSRREPKMLRGSWLVLGLVPDIFAKTQCLCSGTILQPFFLLVSNAHRTFK